MNNDNEYEIPEKATVRQEHVRCGNPDCQHLHGPYLYAYWKDGKKLQKKYSEKKSESNNKKKLEISKN